MLNAGADERQRVYWIGSSDKNSTTVVFFCFRFICDGLFLHKIFEMLEPSKTGFIRDQ